MTTTIRISFSWQHQTTGLISAWLMKGRERVDGVTQTPDRVADTNWRIVGSGDRGDPGMAHQPARVGTSSGSSTTDRSSVTPK